MSHKIDTENLTEEERLIIDEVKKAKYELKLAQHEYSQLLGEASRKVHYKKIAAHTSQSDGAVRMQLRRIEHGKLGLPMPQ